MRPSLSRAAWPRARVQTCRRGIFPDCKPAGAGCACPQDWAPLPAHERAWRKCAPWTRTSQQDCAACTGHVRPGPPTHHLPSPPTHTHTHTHVLQGLLCCRIRLDMRPAAQPTGQLTKASARQQRLQYANNPSVQCQDLFPPHLPPCSQGSQASPSWQPQAEAGGVASSRDPKAPQDCPQCTPAHTHVHRLHV